MLNLVHFDLDFAAEHIENINRSKLADGKEPLAESHLLQKFCHIARIGGVLNVPTKSTLN